MSLTLCVVNSESLVAKLMLVSRYLHQVSDYRQRRAWDKSLLVLNKVLDLTSQLLRQSEHRWVVAQYTATTLITADTYLRQGNINARQCLLQQRINQFSSLVSEHPCKCSCLMLLSSQLRMNPTQFQYR